MCYVLCVSVNVAYVCGVCEYLNVAYVLSVVCDYVNVAYVLYGVCDYENIAYRLLPMCYVVCVISPTCIA